MNVNKRLSRKERQAILWHMLQEARRCIHEGADLRQVRNEVAQLRDELVQGVQEGVILTVEESPEQEKEEE